MLTPTDIQEIRDLISGCPSTPTAMGAWLGLSHAYLVRLLTEIEELHRRAPRESFDVRCADKLADEVDVLVLRKVIDSRSPSADALLDYRNPPTSPRSDRMAALEKRQEELLATIVRLTNETPFPDEVKNALEQRGKLLAEVGTLRASVAEWRALAELADRAIESTKEYVANMARRMEGIADRELDLLNEKDAAYRERNRLVAALARVADAHDGPVSMWPEPWRAGMGRHPEDDATWDREWMTIVFLDTPVGQLSWHVHDSELALFEGIPPYEGTWDGHTTEEKYARLEKLR